MSKAKLSKLAERLSKFEGEIEDRLWLPSASYLLHIVEFMSSLVFPFTTDDEREPTLQTNDERREVWPLFAFLELLSEQAAENKWGRESYHRDDAERTIDVFMGIQEWQGAMYEAAQSSEPRIEAIDLWNWPISPIVLHCYKSICWHGDGRESHLMPVVELYGVPDAEPIWELLAKVSPHPPWHKDFPLNWKWWGEDSVPFCPSWPDGVRQEIEAAVIRSKSMVPEIVPPYDPSRIKQYRFRGGSWPELTGGNPGELFDLEYYHRAEKRSRPDTGEMRNWKARRQAALNA
ncbi:MAG: hypothetical protein EXS09_21360 [Gemmataceae bacterium]|nr:hypothetical protein [Gemmataceae bacterium]